jgi:aryl-alcohol dehydrogenase-like predicted oxidoreductase
VGSCDQQTTESILDYFVSQGGNFIDTANNYQGEESEQWIGEWMKKRGNRDQMVIATKYSTNYRAGHAGEELLVNTQGNGAKSLHTSIAASLRKLQTDYIDLVSCLPLTPAAHQARSPNRPSSALRPLVGLQHVHRRGHDLAQPPRHLW